jgi:hypothetical protein
VSDSNSVIFASVYRFTVLFSYSNADPTFTLAPVVGWTAIEMSVGIMSACLPTLRPALIRLSRMIGIKGSMSALRSRSSNSAGLSNNTGGTTLNSSTDPSRKTSQRAFHRLPDNGDRDVSRTPLEAKLRPDHYGPMVTSVMGAKTDSDSLSGDEVPLHTIRVQTDFKRTDN